jgi:hypothetical protein
MLPIQTTNRTKSFVLSLREQDAEATTLMPITQTRASQTIQRALITQARAVEKLVDSYARAFHFARNRFSSEIVRLSMNLLVIQQPEAAIHVQQLFLPVVNH